MDTQTGRGPTQPPQDRYPAGFEESDQLRSNFIRELTLRQLRGQSEQGPGRLNSAVTVPRRVVQYWHDLDDLPPDVATCMATWTPIRDEGVSYRVFDDTSAAGFIARRFGDREVLAFGRCRHPAMRSDFLRMCFVLAEGGLYVDADDVMVGSEWERVFQSSTLKVQPLGYDVATGQMLSPSDLRQVDLPTESRIFYVNNNPIAAPPGHPVLRHALERATRRLLGDEPTPEIQSTTGPGNLTAVLAAHARRAWDADGHDRLDFELLLDWERVAEVCWELDYRRDSRNWRNMDGH